MTSVPMSQRPTRGALNNIRERLAANESVDFSQELGLQQMNHRIDEMEENASPDPGDVASYFLNQLY